MMCRLTRTKTIAFWFCILVLLLQISGSCGEDKLTDAEIEINFKHEMEAKKKEENAIAQDLGTGVTADKDLMDICENAAGPRPLNEVFSPGRTNYATVDDVSGGFCGVAINSPGIWWWVQGTGGKIRVSSCHLQTNIKVKFSIFTGSCDDLQCVTGSAEPDYECSLLKQDNEKGRWDTLSSAVIFETEIDRNYYILVQEGGGQYQRGTVWLNFRPPEVPQNDNCEDAIGPVPRDMTLVENTSTDATVSKIDDYCDGDAGPSLYPGTWFQIMGTGEPVTIMACSKYNVDGYAFSVYNGAYCDGLECVTGQYDTNVQDPARCTFGSAQVTQPLTKYTFDTTNRDRYFIYVRFAGKTRAENNSTTADFRFYVDDGNDGNGGTNLVI